MREFEEQGGIAFILLRYTAEEISYYLRFKDLEFFWERAKSGGRKSFRIDELDMDWRIEEGGRVPVNYIEAVKKDMEERFRDTV
jgi:recombination protein U